jgi:hypothetical protein
MFSDQAGTVPALTTDTTDGFAFTVDVNLNGSTTVTNYSSVTSIGEANEAVPEPERSTFLSVVTLLALMGAVLRFKQLESTRK